MDDARRLGLAPDRQSGNVTDRQAVRRYWLRWTDAAAKSRRYNKVGIAASPGTCAKQPQRPVSAGSQVPKAHWARKPPSVTRIYQARSYRCINGQYAITLSRAVTRHRRRSHQRMRQPAEKASQSLSGNGARCR
jgi:hypothetical protein